MLKTVAVGQRKKSRKIKIKCETKKQFALISQKGCEKTAIAKNLRSYFRR